VFVSQSSPSGHCSNDATLRRTFKRFQRTSLVYGPTCVACGFNFKATYGSFAEGFIHVHHVRQLSEIGAE
jgi:predicted HNH restriction endonuclease